MLHAVVTDTPHLNHLSAYCANFFSIKLQNNLKNGILRQIIYCIKHKWNVNNRMCLALKRDIIERPADPVSCLKVSLSEPMQHFSPAWDPHSWHIVHSTSYIILKKLSPAVLK
jgi:hypothetical protein